MRYYGIYLSDHAADADQLIDRRVCRSAARTLVRRLNTREMQRHAGQPLCQVPLYYCCRDDEVGEQSHPTATSR